MTTIAAHRGASLRLADNSLQAFRAAITTGCEAIETDVRADGRGRLVLSHDPVAPGDRPCLLSELLELAAGRIALDLEVKEPPVLERLLAAVGDFAGRWMVTSFSPAVVAAVAGRAPAGLLVEAEAERDDPLELAATCGADLLLVEDSLATEPLLARAPLPVWVWTVNAPQRLAGLLSDPRVAGVITDDPARAVALRHAGAPPLS